MAALAMLVYARTLGGEFVVDDIGLILGNPRIHSLRNVPRFFLEGFSQSRGAGYKTGYYRPAVTSTFSLDYALAGPGRPWVFHLTNMLVYAACAVLTHALLRKLIEDRAAAVLAGMLFACLAVHTESVAWISGRTDLLALAFMLGATLCLLRARTHMVTPEGRSARRLLSYHGAAFLLMLLALLSKEVALALLPLWIAFEFTLGRVGRWAAPPARRAGAVVSLAGACVAYLVLRGIALGELGTGGVPNFEPWTPQGLATVALCVFQYLGKMALPVELGFGFEVEPFRTAGALLPVLSLIGAGGLMALTIWATLRRPGVGFALWWVWLGLAPALNIVPITETAAERFAFVPSVGFCLLMGLLVQDVRRNRSGGSDRRWAAAACAAVVVLAAGHACLAASGAGHWRTQRTLYLSTLRSSPDSPVSQEFAAEAYVSDPDTPQRAALHYRRCLELAGGKPHLQLLAHAGLGRFYARQGRLSSALLHLRSALRLDEALAGVRVSLAVVMLEMAMDENLPAGWALAKGHAERVLREEDDPPGDAYVVLGCWKLEMRKDPARAAALFAEAIREDPRLILAAEAAFDEAVKKNPEDPEAHYQLALICAQQGNIEKALRAAGHALRIVPTQRAKDLIEELQSRKQAAQD
ncbi:MAG: tetratricopeptide repeat protein [Candidatus Brocadiia bacterium]|nr:tetratricopeptide repeat protein [Candidatus Brocadiia bacterium]